MSQKEDESLEDYVERFQYNLQWFKIKLDKPTMRTILLKGIRDECVELLNIMGRWDISQEIYDDICDLFRRYSRGISKNHKDSWAISIRSMKSNSRGVTQSELGNLLDDFKTDILSSIVSQINKLQDKQKQVENAPELFILCPKCR